MVNANAYFRNIQLDTALYRFHFNCALRSTLLPGMPDADCKKDSQNHGISGGSSKVDFAAPVIVKNACRSAYINCAVQHLPTAAAETPDPLFCGGDCQRYE